MEYETGQANRLGNRESNQDRMAMVESPQAVLLVVADGMGGHERGELAAQAVVDFIAQAFECAPKPLANPASFLERAVKEAHEHVVELGRRQHPPIEPRTTCAACVVQDGKAWWAHVGDSRVYHLRGDRMLSHTRDHTYVEDLLQQGLIKESDIPAHPMRNYVTECIGGEGRSPHVSVSNETGLRRGDVLLLCSDGLWSALTEVEMTNAANVGSLSQAVRELAQRAEQASYPHSDNITALALRWLEEDCSAQRPYRTGKERRSAKAPADKLSKAIDTISRAIAEYEGEMKQNR